MINCTNIDSDCTNCKLAELGATTCAHSKKISNKGTKNTATANKGLNNTGNNIGLNNAGSIISTTNDIEEDDISISERLTEDDNKLNILLLFIVGIAIAAATIAISVCFR